MADEYKLSPKTAAIYIVVVLVVAFIGVLAGNWFVEWRRGGPAELDRQQWLADNQTSFMIGDPFPNEEVFALDGSIDSSLNLVSGSKTLVLFIAPGCGPCKLAIEEYKKDYEDLPSDLRVIGISTSDTASTAAYKAETGFPFEMYCDPNLMFTQQYDVVQFPSMVGIDEQGRVIFAVHGYREDFGLMSAYEQL